jgi:Methyltransferase domain
MIKGLRRTLRETSKELLHGIFRTGQAVGFDVLPRHFYSSIPDLRELSAHDAWKAQSTMAGVAGTDTTAQLAFLRNCCGSLGFTRYSVHARACERNGEEGYGPIESDVLFAFIARHLPAKVIQVGAGVSTAVILHAAEVVGYKPEILCVDPYPNRFLTHSAASGAIHLIARKIQDVGIDLVTGLKSGDLLFVDSTHAVKPGGDVNYLILEVLPLLPAGAWVHFHDIYFPYDYQPSLFKTLFFSAESTLLQAFLICNPRYAIVLSLSMLHHARQEELREVLPSYHPMPMDQGLSRKWAKGHFPSAAYLHVIA